ncbi:AbrB/MazE/SpoVT family DNA-binding domain-containing protein [Brevundimonas sp.]|jgi:bifunctional DNA-binding transcriptional regulator/antitoxin component of YhaV-PrlF toxin-antitoxin module|uniref:AbrB/MazE/SpoVT family DNA-binding domain-containing protein n=1 Tax=Brevundimonas sp. TaxID=1871086 RepID=UPI002E1539FA|nr:AbrB/MazE/SpoVT family DNA-binding domain-containing protein [Brevundimonas sp.]
MVALTLTAKNQLTLRKEVVKHLGLKPGDKVEAELRPDGRVELVAPRVRTGKISDAFGLIKVKPGTPPLTIEEMNEVIAEGWAEMGKRGL